MDALSIINEIDPDMYLCRNCENWFPKDEVIPVYRTINSNLIGFECQDTVGCGYLKSKKLGEWLVQWRKTQQIK